MPKREAICSHQITSKDCRQLMLKEISISNGVVKYCFKADNFYDFERRVYLLSKFIERKLKKELNVHETKKA